MLVILMFVLIVVRSQVALVAAGTRLERADLPTIATHLAMARRFAT